MTQTLEQQNAALEAAGATKTFSDIMSGTRDDRPGLAALMEYVRAGDTVVVWRLDRLGRNTLHILATVKALTDRGVTLVFGTGVEGRSKWSRRDSRQVFGYRMLKNPILVPPLSNGDVLAPGDNHKPFQG